MFYSKHVRFRELFTKKTPLFHTCISTKETSSPFLVSDTPFTKRLSLPYAQVDNRDRVAVAACHSVGASVCHAERKGLDARDVRHVIAEHS